MKSAIFTKMANLTKTVLLETGTTLVKIAALSICDSASFVTARLRREILDISFLKRIVFIKIFFSTTEVINLNFRVFTVRDTK